MTERLHFTFHFHALEKEMATHSSVLAWRIPETGEPGIQVFRKKQVWTNTQLHYYSGSAQVSWRMGYKP